MAVTRTSQTIFQSLQSSVVHCTTMVSLLCCLQFVILCFLAAGEEFCNQPTENTTVAEERTITLNPATETEYHCKFITIKGTLHIGSNVHLTADRIQVDPTGIFKIGTDEKNPALNVVITLNNDKIIYNHARWPTGKKKSIDNDPGTAPTQPQGKLMSFGKTFIYGEPKTSWTLLNKDCGKGCSVIYVDECVNWRVGDAIVIAPTGNSATRFAERGNELFPQKAWDGAKSEERKISQIKGKCQITLDSQLELLHRYLDMSSNHTFITVQRTEGSGAMILFQRRLRY